MLLPCKLISVERDKLRTGYSYQIMAQAKHKLQIINTIKLTLICFSRNHSNSTYDFALFHDAIK